MPQSDQSIVDYLLIAASVIVIIAGIRAAGPVMVPVLLAVFISIIASTPLLWLERRGAPVAVAMLLVMSGIVAGLGLISWVISNSVRDLNSAVPEYQARLRELLTQSIETLQDWGMDVPETVVADWLDPNRLIQLLATTLSSLGGILSNGLLIFLLVVFMLMEVSSFPGKLRAVFSDPDGQMAHFHRFTRSVNRYMTIKTTISLITGLLATLLCLIVGLDLPLLWGLLAFLLNYIPTIGSLVAAVPPVMLAVVQLDLAWATAVGIGYFVINQALGGFIEPRLQGHTLGMSPLVVVLSLVFWGWMLGPVGMLLSVPLTMTVVIALETHPRTYWIAVLLGPEKPASPPDWVVAARAPVATAESDTVDPNQTHR